MILGNLTLGTILGPLSNNTINMVDGVWDDLYFWNDLIIWFD